MGSVDWIHLVQNVAFKRDHGLTDSINVTKFFNIESPISFSRGSLPNPSSLTGSETFRCVYIIAIKRSGTSEGHKFINKQ
jgi:hypothetical protein